MKNQYKSKSIEDFSYEKSRYIMDFQIAGFRYYDGLEVIDELVVGSSVDLIAEAENPYDPEAIAVYYKGLKVGYMPRKQNQILSSFLYFGYGNIFEAKILYVNKETYPEQKIHVVVKIKDNRDRV